MRRSAHRGDVGLLEDQFDCAPPARAEFCVLVRWDQHVPARVDDRAQDTTVFGWKGLGELFGEICRRQHALKNSCRAVGMRVRRVGAPVMVTALSERTLGLPQFPAQPGFKRTPPSGPSAASFCVAWASGSRSDGLVAVVPACIVTARRVPIVSRRVGVAVRRVTVAVAVRRIAVTVAVTVTVAVGPRRERAADYGCCNAGADPATQTPRL